MVQGVTFFRFHSYIVYKNEMMYLPKGHSTAVCVREILGVLREYFSRGLPWKSMEPKASVDSLGQILFPHFIRSIMTTRYPTRYATVQRLAHLVLAWPKNHV